MHNDQTRLLSEKLESYKHDLEPFTQKLKAEFVCASRAQVDVQRQSMQSVQIQDLPPKFYWDKMEQFQLQMNELRKQLQGLHQHLNDSINNPQPTEVVNTKSVANALNASRRTTLSIAAQVISNHEQIQRLKAEYKQYRLEVFGDSHDPFFDAKEKEKQRQQKIHQYLHDQGGGLQMNALQVMGTGNGGNAWNAGNGNTANAGNNSNGGSNSNNNNNNNNAVNAGNNNGGGSTWGTTNSGGSAFNFGNTSSSATTNNNANSGSGSGFNWGAGNNTAGASNSNNSTGFKF